MPELNLSFACKDDSLLVRRFSVHEGMSSLFSVSVWARSRSDDLDFEAFVGKDAGLRIASGLAHALVDGTRHWSGVCSAMEQVAAESTGVSTYYLRIVPRLWLLTQRRNHRLFQHISIPDIVDRMLDEWTIERTWKIDRPAYPQLELRSQYGESDYDFLSRLLEEAGIAFHFVHDEKKGSVLVLNDAPQSVEPRPFGPIRFVDNPNQAAEQEFVTGIRAAQDVRPNRYTLRDFDFRRRPDFQLFGKTPSLGNMEDMLEQYHFTPGSFLIEHPVQAVGELLGGGPGGFAAKVPEKVAAKADKVVSTADKVASKADKVADKVGSLVEKTVGGIVDEKVTGLVDKSVTKIAGKTAGEIVGGVAGDAAGGLAGRIAGKIAGGIVGKIAGLVGDDKGMARFDEKAGQARAERRLESARASRRNVTLETNVIDIGVGVVFSITHHPRPDLAPDKTLLVVESSVEGTPDGGWSMSAHAVFAAETYRPPAKTPKPHIQGMQTAIVVGPKGEEIHTDEFGRVRVQFHWDREGGYDEGSSCWMRVSQGWAGSGYGMIAIPRVGQEVLVAFLEGDPDHPVVIGRLFNNTSRVPYNLPEHKTRSTWKSDSTPNSNGFNELMFEDAKGRELVYVQAERDLEKLVKRNEAISVGNDRRTSVGAVDESHVGVRHNVTMRQTEAPRNEKGPTHFEMIDNRIHLSTGEASITLDGPNITLQAKGRVLIHSTDDTVEILGGPWVKINCDPITEHTTVTLHHITGIIRDQDREPLANQPILIKSSDGSVQQITTDINGRYFALVPPGKCFVSTPGKPFGKEGPHLDKMDITPIGFDGSGPTD